MSPGRHGQEGGVMRRVLWNTLAILFILPLLITAISCTKTVYVGETPTPATQHGSTVWDVQWQAVTSGYELSGTIATQQFPATFHYNWGKGAVYANYSDWIGFAATATIKVQRPSSSSVSFQVGSDDGTRLYIDDSLVISNWRTGGYQTQSGSAYLSPGFHTLRIEYFENVSTAEVSFSCDSDVLQW